jgi:hypothetical protein
MTTNSSFKTFRAPLILARTFLFGLVSSILSLHIIAKEKKKKTKGDAQRPLPNDGKSKKKGLSPFLYVKI